jgi:hypothetical protein
LRGKGEKESGWRLCERRMGGGGGARSDGMLPAVLRKALVHRVLRGFFFILKFLWHFDRQNRKVCRQGNGNGGVASGGE